MSLARTKVCVSACQCAHDRTQISAIAIGKSSELAVTLMLALISNSRHAARIAERRARSFHLCKKIYEQSAFAWYDIYQAYHRTTPKASVTPAASRISCALTLIFHTPDRIVCYNSAILRNIMKL